MINNIKDIFKLIQQENLELIKKDKIGEYTRITHTDEIVEYIKELIKISKVPTEEEKKFDLKMIKLWNYFGFIWLNILFISIWLFIFIKTM